MKTTSERKKHLSESYRLLELVCTNEENGAALGDFLRQKGISRRLITLLKRTEKGITRNNILCKTVDTVFAGDKICLRIPASGKEKDYSPEPNFSLKAEKAYEDEDIIVYNKPAFMPVHESALHRRDTLANLFAAEYGGIPFRSVNRLDRDTSGLVLTAKNRHSANIPNDKISKIYYAVCQGDISEPMRIDAPIARERESMIKRVVRSDGQAAATNIVPIKRCGSHTLLEIRLETGRTHQIRVHLAYIGHPLEGDELYGGSRKYISRQALHCGKMSITHPVSGRVINVEAPLPSDIVNLIQIEV